ncbi:MAG: hypothetical protein WB985_20480 [Candidatus Acidiferrales bacterium]
MNTSRAAYEFRSRYGSIRIVERVALRDYGIRRPAAPFNAAQDSVNEEVLVAFEENYISRAQHFEIPAAHEHLIARAKPRMHVAIQDAHARRTLRANLGADCVGMDL